MVQGPASAVVNGIVSGCDDAVRAEPARERGAVRHLVSDVANESDGEGDRGRPELPKLTQNGPPPTHRPFGSKVEDQLEQDCRRQHEQQHDPLNSEYTDEADRGQCRELPEERRPLERDRDRPDREHERR